MGHITQDGEDDDGRKEAGEGVDGADDEGVSVAIVVEFVVAAQGQESSDADAVRVEDLGAFRKTFLIFCTSKNKIQKEIRFWKFTSIDPTFAHRQPVPVRGEQEDDALQGSIQAQGLDGQDTQDDVGEKGEEPQSLKPIGLFSWGNYKFERIRCWKNVTRVI